MTQNIDPTPPWQAPPPPPQPPARPWYRMKRVWAGGVVALLIIAGAAGGSNKKDASLAVQKGSAAEPTTQPTAAPTTATTSVPSTTAPKPTTTTTVKVTTTTTEAVSACDAVKEALLTGTQTQINAAMTQLIADKTADSTAREYADYYMHRDAPGAYGSKDLRSMDVTLIRSACS